VCARAFRLIYAILSRFQLLFPRQDNRKNQKEEEEERKKRQQKNPLVAQRG